MLRDFKTQTISKLPNLFFGFFLCSFGITMMYKARDLGLGPWDVFHTGVMNFVPLTFGQISQLAGFIVILLSMFLGIMPGLGTLLNMIFVGLFIDLIDHSPLLFTPGTFWGKLIMLQTGVWILSLGIFFYLKSGLGAGPRDGLMLGLVRRLNLKVATVKTTIEVLILVLGALLGGKVGLGTVVVALSMGYAIQVVFKIGKYDVKTVNHRTLKDEFVLLRKTA
ncbi:membrane protein [Alkalicella caledoniensis]|uniref:Membrane protein n=1 Tax=Alkalicella caledoniensis TaxID=2731377 RepID=A0A7G9W5F8_ALKCA|nr:membrane protein [Alkalicella caledoniensis]QNO13920.1 membrane protein [Alkalicella caledoniensis]